MGQFAKEILPVNIEDEMRQSYLDYAMSVIIGRALPDVRDGLKPVHRRSLYAMQELGNAYNKPYKKSARIVGECLGRYHPHGDSSVYDAIVRMAQPFSLRYMLVDGQGNFGSIDADSPAAMRYTEIRMAKMSHELLADIDKETVDFNPNYDESEQEPSVFPTRVPNLLINGSSGIAVGMATNIPPHNLVEVINACIALIEQPELSVEDLMEHIPGPDFPTAGIIHGVGGIVEAYRTGRGRVYMRARTCIEDEDNGKQKIVATELPYQTNKARLIEKIAELIKEKKVEGITALRDESDKDGIRVVIELRRGEIADVVLNNLFKHTQMQAVFGINMVALVDGEPRLLPLKSVLELFIRHRKEIVTRRSVFELRKAKERTHVLEGLAVALSNIDKMIVLIKAAKNPQEARQGLLSKIWESSIVKKLLQQTDASVSRPDTLASEFGLLKEGYRLSNAQAQAILELRLHRLTGLEKDKIVEEFQSLLIRIHELLDILNNTDRLMQVIRDELLAIRDGYGDKRRTEITFNDAEINIEDLIPEEDVLVTLSHEGYIKSQDIDTYSAQKRGGKGKSATQMKEADFIDKVFVANTHNTLLCFTSAGKVYWLKVYQLPRASRISRGRPIVNLLPLEANERVNAVLPIQEFVEDKFVFMATAKGVVKKTSLDGFSRPRANGIIAINLDDDDQLIGVDITDGKRDVMLFSKMGKAVHFQEENTIRATGRTARGVRGIRLAPEDKVISLIVNYTDGMVMTATVNGFGKRTPIDSYPIKGRGGKGVIAIKTSERNGEVVGAVQIAEDDDIMLITNAGTLVRTPVVGISVVSRNTQGVNLIRLKEGEKLVGLNKILELNDDNEDEAE
ncbi:DNA gyrase subunit A [Candidatus Halobeggiatoa sp. HSG11]|nr:DNA gyrase subunit A [Candidatus Halobeggiatoa sp. HSG11]